jgi:tetratricopeptide (TPR) repeat protein
MSGPVSDDEVVSLIQRRLGTMSEAFQRFAMLLSICLSVTETELSWLAEEVWGHSDTGHAVIDQVFSWPFVEETGDGYRILPVVGVALARQFQQVDPDAFMKAHRLMADREREAMERTHSVDEVDDFLDGWFARGRLAFYLAGVHPDESSYEFGHAFEESMSLDARTTRIWLSTLVIRQQHLLADHLRVVYFFLGFRAYTANHLQEAKSYFDEVLDDDTSDVYRAISLHLSAQIIKVPQDRLKLLRESIDLSRKLELVQNEIMARNSLAAANVVIANSARRDTSESRQLFGEAVRLAEENLTVSRRIDDKSYLSVCLAMHATSVWDATLDMKGDLREVYDGVIKELNESIAAADRSRQVDVALRALNKRASVNRDYGDYQAAIDDLREATARLGYGFESSQLKVRIAKTAGSLRRGVPLKLRSEVENVLAELNNL